MGVQSHEGRTAPSKKNRATSPTTKKKHTKETEKKKPDKKKPSKKRPAAPGGQAPQTAPNRTTRQVGRHDGVVRFVKVLLTTLVTAVVLPALESALTEGLKHWLVMLNIIGELMVPGK